MNTKLIQSKAKYISCSRRHFLALFGSSAHTYFLACWTSGATGTTDAARLTHGVGLGQDPGADDPGQDPGADGPGQGPGADGLVRARGVDAPDRDHGRAHDQGGGEGAHLPGDAAAAAAPAADHAGTTQSQHN